MLIPIRYTQVHLISQSSEIKTNVSSSGAVPTALWAPSPCTVHAVQSQLFSDNLRSPQVTRHTALSRGTPASDSCVPTPALATLSLWQFVLQHTGRRFHKSSLFFALISWADMAFGHVTSL